MSFIEDLLKNYSNVHIHDDRRDFVEQTIRSIINDGRKMLHVVADFDFTLTSYEKDGKMLPSSYGVLEGDQRITLPDGSLLGAEANRLRKKYHPIEYDFQMSIEEKIPHMIEWWNTAESMILSSNLNQSMIQQMVDESKMELRKGVKEFIRELLRTQVPILIFSAGLGDIIEIFLQKEIPEFKHNHELSHIVSNFFQYDINGKLIQSNKKIIHSFNKNEHEIHNTSYYQSILNRPNVILIGDVTGDVAIIEGMKNLKQILKIGYLNRSTPAKLEGYKSVYDIVICDDLTFDVPNVILNAIQ